jgi:signal peptidase
MNLRTLGSYTLGAIVVVFVGSLLVGQLLGQPVLLAFVETGSMSPTLEPGDGFIAVPAEIAGPVEEGDVVTFRAETLNGGSLTTHRVVDETSSGFITKGDANPVTDQDGDEPPVERDQIVAKALQVGGTVVVIPKVGVLVTGVNDLLSTVQRTLATMLGTRALLGTQGLAYLLFAVGVLSYVVSAALASEKRERRTRRETGVLDARLVIVGLTAVLVLILTLSMVAPAGAQTFTFVSSQSDAPGPSVIPTGESENLTYVVPSNGLVPTVVYLEPGSEGINVTPQRLYVGSGGQANATVTISAPPETGSYERTLVEHRYLALLPRSIIHGLYTVHPWLPILAINALVGLGFVGIASAVVGWGAIRVDSRTRQPLLRRLRRWLR